MKGQWIIKEVYFEDGFPKIIRDLKPETPYTTLTEREELAGNPTNGEAQLPIRKAFMTRDDIIRMAREAGFADGVVDIVGFEGFANFAALVAAHERQACVAIVLDNSDADGICCTDDVLEAFRQRGEK